MSEKKYVPATPDSSVAKKWVNHLNSQVRKGGDIGVYSGNKNKEISNEEYRHLLNTLYGCLKEADNGKEYKEMVGEEIIKRHNRRQSPLLKQ